MDDSQEQGKKAMKVAIYVLLVTWIILLLLLLTIYILRLQGYNSFTEWKNRNQVQEVFKPEQITPKPTETPKVTPTKAPEIAGDTSQPQGETATPAPTVTELPTETPGPMEPPVRTMVFSGNELVDRKLRARAEELFGVENEVCYVSYAKGIYFSIVFQTETEVVPLVFHLDTGEQVLGSDLIKETYFAIVKERLQTYVAEHFPEESEDEFVSYKQVYQAGDYQKIYFTNDRLVFCFDADTLTESHPAFSYEVELSEAEAFFKTDFAGNPKEPYIRKLDPEAKMIAITFDDGPHDKIEQKILDLFEQYEGRTTFFLLGDRIENLYPNMPAKLYEAGHEVASHTYSHTVNFATDGEEKIWSEINRTNLAIANATGYAPDYVRFPGGSFGKRVMPVPMIKVNWSLDSVDYKDKNKKNGAQTIFNRLTDSSKLGDGAIVLVHSIYQNSYDAMELFLKYLTEEGYELVTLSELFYYKGPELKTDIVYKDGFGNPAKSN